MFEVEDEMAGAELSAGIVAFCVEKLVLVIFVFGQPGHWGPISSSWRICNQLA